ncbi:caspase family protein [Erythrobacter crassostreae]|uniref:Caspase family protein n=1 Tax=Erythrobacter crassostreae TaxID=2828328 RepID=A0A9X1F594_9SPHN|nr:caspase family protein [Erythrobacter crassostrea]MBV7260196.1 caspase family protein [Erythrobacter crassostrea]
MKLRTFLLAGVCAGLAAPAHADVLIGPRVAYYFDNSNLRTSNQRGVEDAAQIRDEEREEQLEQILQLPTILTSTEPSSAVLADQIGFPMVGAMINFGDDRDRFTLIGMYGEGAGASNLTSTRQIRLVAGFQDVRDLEVSNLVGITDVERIDLEATWQRRLNENFAITAGVRYEQLDIVDTGELIAANYEAAENEALRLANPRVEVGLVSSALRGTSVSELTVLEERAAQEWQEGLDLWLDTLSGDDIGLFYFAGHRFQIEGQNFLMSSDGKSLTPLGSLVTQITERERGAIIVINACRNNPYFDVEPDDQIEIVEISGATRSINYVTFSDISASSGGLEQLGNLRGLSAVAFFSTEPGNVAEDGPAPGKGSPFAIEFAKQIARRQSLDEVFCKTAIAVTERTENRQSPWRQGDLAFNVFVSGMRALPIP